jgi:Mor family transcriptional regulator
MSKAKTARNQKILALFRDGMTVYKIAKRYDLTWPRTKRIIQEQQTREKGETANV